MPSTQVTGAEEGTDCLVVRPEYPALLTVRARSTINKAKANDRLIERRGLRVVDFWGKRWNHFIGASRGLRLHREPLLRCYVLCFPIYLFS